MEITPNTIPAWLKGVRMAAQEASRVFAQRSSPPRRQSPTGGRTKGIHAVVSATFLSLDVA
eukprot:1540131-Rhodomonas_salina.1